MGSFIKNELEPFSYLIYAIVIFLQAKKEKSILRKVHFCFYFFSFIALSYASKIAWDETDNNNWIYNIHYIASSLFFGYYFFNLLISRTLKFLSICLYFFSGLILILTSYFITGSFFNSYGSALLFIIVVITCFLYFKQRFLRYKEEKVLLTFDLWIVLGYLLYFLGAFLVILTYSYFTNKLPPEKQYLLADIWAVQNILLFIASLLSLIGYLWVSSRKVS